MAAPPCPVLQLTAAMTDVTGLVGGVGQLLACTHRYAYVHTHTHAAALEEDTEAGQLLVDLSNTSTHTRQAHTQDKHTHTRRSRSLASRFVIGHLKDKPALSVCKSQIVDESRAT